MVLGAGGGLADLGQQYAMRAALPVLGEGNGRAVQADLPEWTEDSFAGLLLNVAAGRVANRFDDVVFNDHVVSELPFPCAITADLSVCSNKV